MDGTTILVPLDGSDLAEAALPYADALASALGKRIRLMSVVETELEHLLPAHVQLSAGLEKARRDAVEFYLDRVEASLRARGHEIETVAVPGVPSTEILVASEHDEISMVAIATHGRGGLQRWVVGSVADKVMRMASRPTLLVRPAQANAPTLGSVRFRRLLVPLDGSEFAASALEPAEEIAKAAGATITLVSVVHHLSTAADWEGQYVPELETIENELVAEAKSKLEELRKGLSSGLSVETVVLRGAAAMVLQAFAAEQQTDLVIMTTHGRGGLQRLVLGSTAGRLVHAGIPTLLVHAVTAGVDVDADR